MGRRREEAHAFCVLFADLSFRKTQLTHTLIVVVVVVVSAFFPPTPTTTTTLHHLLLHLFFIFVSQTFSCVSLSVCWLCLVASLLWLLSLWCVLYYGRGKGLWLNLQLFPFSRLDPLLLLPCTSLGFPLQIAAMASNERIFALALRRGSCPDMPSLRDYWIG